MKRTSKYNLGVNKGITAALVTTISTMSGVSIAQIIKNNGAALDKVAEGFEAEAKVNGEPKEKSAKSNPPVLKELPYKDLIQLLSSDDYKMRKKVHEFIWRQGKAIIPVLEKGADSNDPEIALRASDILRNLRIGVTYDTPKHIADKIAAFQTALLDKKDDILRDLFQERAYNHMVYMLAEMKNRDHADKLHKNFKELAHLAAREEIYNDNIKGAIELLKMSPQTPAVRRSLAFIYVRTGLAEAEIVSLSAQLKRGAVDKQWMLTLLQEMGDRPKLREFAHEVGYSNTIAVLDLLEGRPEGLIKALGRKPTFNQAIAIDIVKQVYQGRQPQEQADLHLKLLEEAQKSSRLKKFLPMHLLFLTGGERLGESILLRSAPNKALHFLEERERPAEALAAIGLTNEASIIKWRDPIIERILKPKKEEEKDWRKEQDPNFVNDEEMLLDVASFYSRRGDLAKAKLILEPLLKALHKDNNDQWLNVLADFPRYNMHELAMHYIIKQGDNDDITKMINVLFDGTESIDLVWKSLVNRPKKSVKDSFQDIAILMGMYRGMHDKRDELEAYLIQKAKKSGVDAVNRMYLALYQVADYRYDSVNAKKYLSLVMKAKASKEMNRARVQDWITIAGMNLDWQELTDTFKKHPAIGSKSAEWLTVRSIAERELGNDKEADALLEKATLMTIGLGDEINEILSELISAGDSARANTLLERRLLIQSESIDAFSFYTSLGSLASENSHYVLSGQWEKASAMSYAANVITLTFLRDEILEPARLLDMMKMNFTLNFTRGMYFSKKGEHQKAKYLLNSANECILGDGVLADNFYPAVSKTPYKKEYLNWVKESHEHIKSSLEDFPHASNTHNTLAWVLSRSLVNVDQGLSHSAKALELAPGEAAYVDTMAEVWFAKGDRKMAVEWGIKAVKACKTGCLVTKGGSFSTKARTLSLYGQLKRFKSEPLPKL